MKTVRNILLLLLALCCLVGAACAITALVRRQRAEAAAEAKQLALEEAAAAFALPAPELRAETEAGALLLDAWKSVRRAEAAGPLRAEGDAAELPLTLTTLEPGALRGDLAAALQSAQLDWVAAAARRSEVYEEDGSVRPELIRKAFPALLGSLLVSGEYTRTEAAALRLCWDGETWRCENTAELAALLDGELTQPDALAEALLEEAAGTLSYVPLHYTIPEDALAGPAPDPACFGETEDLAVIEALLQSPEAQRLIAGRETVWNADIVPYPKGKTIRWYLDETILVLVWQEVEHGGVGTFSEVFIADGSQFRRKISADTIYDLHFETVSSFARQTQAVLASGGDMYYHGRMCGVGFYQRRLYRFEPYSCDTCYVNGAGDLLFSYRGQFTSEEEALAFAEENDVIFSLVFGPVLIDGGVDVTPDRYAWGQILDEYARAAIGQLGERHYLLMNLNCGTHQYYKLFTLREAADSMIKRGCERAYTLDGGQTATTVFRGKLINPVQFGWERQVSDIIYFATAIPEE